MEFPTKRTAIVDLLGNTKKTKTSNTTIPFQVDSQFQLGREFMSTDVKRIKNKQGPRVQLKDTMIKKQTLKRIMRPEKKEKGTYQAWGAVDKTTGAQIIWTPPVQGTEKDKRIGSRIQIVSLRARGSLAQFGTAVAGGYRTCRVCLVKQFNVNNASLPANNNILDVSTLQDYTVANVRIDKKKSFKIIREEYFELDQIPGEGYHYDFYVKLNDIMELSANNGSYTDSTNFGYFLAILPGTDTETSQDSFRAMGAIIINYIDV